jgi:1,2-diacylglycerol 3-alpha-glucosyltransferase
MKIAIFTNNYLPNPYGVSMSIETFRREFEKKGHTVYIFAPKFPGFEDSNENVFRYPALDVNIKFRFPLAFPYSSKISKVLENMDIDIIHAQHPNLLGTAARKWARKKEAPLVFTWHTLYDQYTDFVPFLPSKFSANYMIKKAVKFANDADAVVAPTDSIIPILKRWGVHPVKSPQSGDAKGVFNRVKKEIYVVPTGVIEEEFSGSDRNKIRIKYKIADDEILLLMVSRLTSEKNVEFVFRAVKDILKNNKAKFMVVSDGYLLPKLQKFCEDNGISDKVIFAGIIGRDEIKNYFAAGDIFVYGSKSETQGMILTEAMYMGLPIVAVCATGATSLVRNNRNGFLAGAGGEKEFAYMATKLILDKDLCKKTGQESARIARENFTSSICAEKMLDLYEKTIKKKESEKVR